MFPVQVTKPAHYNVSYLQLLVQGEQYSIFRYKPPGAPWTIIKRARIDTSTLKYMLREKAMLGYLKHDGIVELKRSFSPTLLLADGEGQTLAKGKGNYHDTYV